MRKTFATAITQERDEEETGAVLLEFNIQSNVAGRLDDALSNFWYHQEQPSPALFSLIAAGATDNASEGEKAGAIWDYFKGTLPIEEYRHLRNRFIVAKDIDIDALVEVVEGTMEFWGTFPTKPSSDSSPSPTVTGRRSMGRVPGPGSTLSS
jgi:hypothetical protein